MEVKQNGPGIYWYQRKIFSDELQRNYELSSWSFFWKPISKKCNILWPPKSLNLAILVFLPATLKARDVRCRLQPVALYLNQPQAAVVREVRALQRSVVINTFRAIRERCEGCINAIGQHLLKE